MGLIAESGSVVGGDILYEGKSLLGMKESFVVYEGMILR